LKPGSLRFAQTGYNGKILHSARTVYLWVLYSSQNKQRYFPIPIFISETGCEDCELRTESLNKIQVNLNPQKINSSAGMHQFILISVVTLLHAHFHYWEGRYIKEMELKRNTTRILQIAVNFHRDEVRCHLINTYVLWKRKTYCLINKFSARITVCARACVRETAKQNTDQFHRVWQFDLTAGC
jgi:hypothetical protein